MLQITKDNFKNEVEECQGLVVIDLYADWCGPCRMVSPIVDEIAKENPDYLVGKINVDNEPKLAQDFDVSSIPVLLVMRDGKIVNQSVGAKTKQQILAMIED